MSTYVLVHGAFHGAWCWYKIIPQLERSGHEVIALDLPSLGSDKTPIAEVTLDLWTHHVCHALDTVSNRCILVGHSRGGIVISQAAERRPEKVETLVYVAAILLRNGESLLDSATFDTAALGQTASLSSDKRSISFNSALASEAFYTECPEEDATLAKLLLQPEALAPMLTPLQLSETRYGGVPRVYIECLRDRTLLPDRQKAMYTASPCRKIISMDTDHSPFFSRPSELADHLLKL